MTQPIERDPIYRSRRLQTEAIELCVRWYVTYRLSYRDLAAMVAARGVVVSHTTIMRWVLHYVPEFEKRWARYAQHVNTSWRMDETAIHVRGKSTYLYGLRELMQLAVAIANRHCGPSPFPQSRRSHHRLMRRKTRMAREAAYELWLVTSGQWFPRSTMSRALTVPF